MTGFARRFARKPVAVAALAWLAVLTLAAIFAPLVTYVSPQTQDLAHALAGPSGQHWLGTGELGVDVYSWIIYGGRVTLPAVAIATAVYVLVGTLAGLAAGYFTGWTDRAVTAVSEILLAVPAIVVILVVLSAFPDNEPAAMVTLGLLGSPALGRVVRAVTLRLRNEPYVRSARACGLTEIQLLRRHILPRLAGTIGVQASLFAAAAVLVEAGLGFLGLSSSTTSWGALLAQAYGNMGQQPWLIVPSGAVVISAALSFGLLGDGIRDAISEAAAATPAAPTPSPAALVSRSPAAAGAAPLAACDRPGPEQALSVVGLTVTVWRGGQSTTVVDDITFDIAPGEAVGLVGESGCGKTMTARAILGLLPAGARMSAGSVFIGRTDIAALAPAGWRDVRGARVGWIPQEPAAALDPCFTVGSQLAEVVRAHTRCTRAQARARVADLLRLVRFTDVDTVARRYPHELSGGMAQRVNIAAALAPGPSLLIADEPTAALDVTVQAEILRLLHDLRESSGMALLFVTHNFGVLAQMCDRAITMYAGQTVEAAPVAQLLSQPRHPYTRALIAASPSGATRGGRLTAIPGAVPDPGRRPAGCRFAPRCDLATSECQQEPVGLIAIKDLPGLTRCIHSGELVCPLWISERWLSCAT